MNTLFSAKVVTFVAIIFSIQTFFAQEKYSISNLSHENDNDVTGFGSVFPGSKNFLQFNVGPNNFQIDTVILYCAAYPQNTSRFAFFLKIVDMAGNVVVDFRNPQYLSTTGFNDITFAAYTPGKLLANTTYQLELHAGSSTYFTLMSVTNPNYTMVPANCISFPPNCYSLYSNTQGYYTTTGYPVLEFKGVSCASLPVTASAQSICAGQSTTLTASGSSSYSWEPGGMTTPSITVSPASTTLYRVYGTQVNNCTPVGSSNIKVNTIPKISASLPNNQTMINTPIVLTANAPGANSFTWSPTTNMNPANGQAAIVSITPPGLGSTTYTITSNQNCTNTVTVVACPLLTSSASATQVCSGAAVTLTATGSYDSFSWSDPAGQSGTSITVNPGATTTYTVTAQKADGCVQKSSVTINVTPLPVIQGLPPNNILTTGQSYTLTATARGANSFSWNPQLYMNPSNGSGASVVITPSSPGQVNYTINSNQNCPTVLPLRFCSPLIISPSSVTICKGQPLTLSASGYLNISWTDGINAITNQPVFPATNTVYTANASDNSGCAQKATLTALVKPTFNATVTPSSAFIVSGQSVTLTASGAGSYSWSPTTNMVPANGTGATVTVTPTVSTIYTVNSPSPNSCSGGTNVYVKVMNSAMGEALNFSAANKNYVNCGNNAALQFYSGTVQVSFMAENLPVGPNFAPLISKLYAWGISVNENGIIISDFISSYSDQYFPTKFLNDFRWHQITLTFQDKVVNGTKVYLDGVLVGTTTLKISRQTQPVILGTSLSDVRYRGDSRGFYFSGNMDEVKLWDRILCADEITSTVNCPVSSVASGLVCYYKFDQGAAFRTNTSVKDLIDATGKNKGILQNFLLDGEQSNWVNPGFFSASTTACTFTPRASQAVSPASVTLKLGDVVTLNASGGSSYSWLPTSGLNSSTSGSVQANPSVSTTYTLTGTIGTNGCTFTQTVPINVVSFSVMPSIPAGNGPKSIAASRMAFSNWVVATNTTAGGFVTAIINPMFQNNAVSPYTKTFSFKVGDTPEAISFMSVKNNLNPATPILQGLAVASLTGNSVKLLAGTCADNSCALTIVKTFTGFNKPRALTSFRNGTYYSDPYQDPFGKYSEYVNLAVCNTGSNTVSVFMNDRGSNNYINKNYTVGAEPISVCSADLDGDLDDDLIVANYNGGNAPGTVSLMTNDGQGNFTVAPMSVNPGPRAVTVDIDGDMDYDIVVASYQSHLVEVMINDGKGNFTKFQSVDLGTSSNPVSLASGDLNNDGFSDVVIGNDAGMNASGTTVSVCFSNRNGTLSTPVNYSLPGAGLYGIVVADFDFDNKKDIIVTGFRSNTIQILKNTSP